MDMDFVIVRGLNSGVYCGYIESRDETEVILAESRWLYSWDKTQTVDNLAVNGPINIDSCVFREIVKRRLLIDILDIIYVSDDIREMIMSIPIK